jgi:hypothetical protein
MKAFTNSSSPPSAATPQSTPTIAEAPVVSRAVTKWLVMLTVLVLGTWLAGGLLFLRQGLWGAGGKEQEPAADASQEPAAKTIVTQRGPWGDLDYAPIMLSPPLELVPEFAPAISPEVLWRFPDTSSSALSAVLGEIGLPEALRTELLSAATLDPAIGGFTIRPSRELVLGLSRETRAKLYIMLAAHADNGDQFKAFRFCGDSPEEWFVRSRISDETKKLVLPLVYQHGGYQFFADLRSVEGSLSSQEERLRLLKTLSREATFLVKLKVTANSDIDALVNYWGRGGRAKDVRPILESLAVVEGGEKIDIVHLLPSFARGRIYNYPLPLEKGRTLKRDCHWSSFNFFSAEADDRFCDDDEVTRTLQQEYYRVYGNFQLGDLVLYFASDESFIHSAVYIADDFVFTKNGNLSSRPWMFTKLADMKSFYPTLKPLEVRFYRRKDI